MTNTRKILAIPAMLPFLVIFGMLIDQISELRNITLSVVIATAIIFSFLFGLIEFITGD